MKELKQAISTCEDLQREIESHTIYDKFGEKMRLVGAFLEDDFNDVIAAMEEALERIEELEGTAKELQEEVETLQAANGDLEDRVQELEAAAAQGAID